MKRKIHEVNNITETNNNTIKKSALTTNVAISSTNSSKNYNQQRFAVTNITELDDLILSEQKKQLCIRLKERDYEITRLREEILKLNNKDNTRKRIVLMIEHYWELLDFDLKNLLQEEEEQQQQQSPQEENVNVDSTTTSSSSLPLSLSSSSFLKFLQDDHTTILSIQEEEKEDGECDDNNNDDEKNDETIRKIALNHELEKLLETKCKFTKEILIQLITQRSAQKIDIINTTSSSSQEEEVQQHIESDINKKQIQLELEQLQISLHSTSQELLQVQSELLEQRSENKRLQEEIYNARKSTAKAERLLSRLEVSFLNQASDSSKTKQSSLIPTSMNSSGISQQDNPQGINNNNNLQNQIHLPDNDDIALHSSLELSQGFADLASSRMKEIEVLQSKCKDLLCEITDLKTEKSLPISENQISESFIFQKLKNEFEEIVQDCEHLRSENKRLSISHEKVLDELRSITYEQNQQLQKHSLIGQELVQTIHHELTQARESLIKSESRVIELNTIQTNPKLLDEYRELVLQQQLELKKLRSEQKLLKNTLDIKAGLSNASFLLSIKQMKLNELDNNNTITDDPTTTTINVDISTPFEKEEGETEEGECQEESLVITTDNRTSNSSSSSSRWDDETRQSRHQHRSRSSHHHRSPRRRSSIERKNEEATEKALKQAELEIHNLQKKFDSEMKNIKELLFKQEKLCKEREEKISKLTDLLAEKEHLLTEEDSRDLAEVRFSEMKLKKDLKSFEDTKLELNSLKEINEALASELESMVLAFEETQDQNTRLVLQFEHATNSLTQVMLEHGKDTQLNSILKAKTEALEKQISLEQQSRNDLNDLNSQLKKECASYKEASDKYRTKSNLLHASNENLLVGIKEASLQNTNLEQQMTTLQKQSNISQHKVKQLTRDYQDLQDRVTRLQEQRDVLKRRCDLYGVQGSVGELEIELEAIKAKLRCSVCSRRQKDVVITSCFHCFCHECIKQNLSSRHRKCPGCGKAFGQNDVHTLYLAQ